MKNEFERNMPLQAIVSKEHLFVEEPMRRHTTFRVGGVAEYYITPSTQQEIVDSVMFCKKQSIPYYIIGNGSNLLVSETGYQGVIIQIGKKFSKIEILPSKNHLEEELLIRAEAGASLAEVAHVAYENSCEGFAFAAGIPGTIGGGITMNAGAYDGEMKQVVTEVAVMNQAGEVVTLSKEELDLSYRHSCIPSNEYIVLSVSITLKKGNQEEIRAHMEELKERRMSKQPLEFPSAGSTFKRPKGHFAGKLIGDAGLSGATIGGAKVSEKHNGFIINTGSATATDIYELIQKVRETVERESGVWLELEVRLLGQF